MLINFIIVLSTYYRYQNIRNGNVGGRLSVRVSIDDVSDSQTNQILNLSFGNEKVKKKAAAPNKANTIDISKGSHALCYPTDTRPNGCHSLFSSQGNSNVGLPLLPLPCVSGQPWPYKKFRCTRGHKWKVNFNFPHQLSL